LFYSETIAIRETDTSRTISIPLTPIEINASIVLNNIFFESNKSELKPESVSELNKIVQLLTDNPTVEVEISGHTDNIGQPNDNLILSNNRAAAVVKYLLSKGIAGKRLHAKGWGAAKPISDNRTEEGRAQNRRTELKVLSK
jgi:outer membrane protein OmpA-like peptidoglycan-associated protein